MGDLQGPCHVCGIRQGTNTCKICGRLACGEHFDARMGVCSSCKHGMAVRGK